MVSIASVDLNLVRVLHTVLAEGNVARAAARLHVTPSAVSNALARLRDVLGDPLVTRRGRGIVATARAMELAPTIARALEDIDAAFTHAPFDPARSTRLFTLALADVGQIVWGPRIAVALGSAMPLAKLRIVGIDSLIGLGDLASPEVDVHLGIPSRAAGVHGTRLTEEGSVLVARSPRARRLSPEALARLGHVRVDMAPGRNLRDPHAAAFAHAGIARDVVVTVPSFTVAAEVVATSDLVAVLPASLFAAKGKALGLAPMHTPLTLAPIPIAMCWHDRTHTDPAARAFRAVVRDAVTSTLGPRPVLSRS